MNILFIHEVEWIDKVVFDIHYLAEALSLRGHQVFGIYYEDKWSRKSLTDLVSPEKKMDNVSRAIPGASVSLTCPGYIKLPGLGRISAAVTHYRAIRNIIKERKIDAIVLYSVPTNGLQTISLAKIFNIPVIFRSIDILHQLVPYPGLRPITKFMEKKIYSKSDLILTLTPKGSSYVIELGAPKEKVKWLKMPVDTVLFRPSTDTAEMRHKLGYGESDQIIVFIGTLFEFSGLDDLIRCFHKVIEEIPTVKLLIVGDGPQRQMLEEIILETGLSEQVIITGFKPYNTMPQYINLAALCLLPFRIAEVTRDIFPGKITQYLACGKVVIATPLPGTTAVIPPDQGYLVYANGGEEVAQEIITLLKAPERRHPLEQEAVKYVTNEHSCDKIAQQLENNIIGVIRKKKNGELS
ncbi:glycosyltransferase family 4 protein [Chloroflexota bacterium]